MALDNLFNEAWYLRNNPDVAAAVEAGLIDARTHFEQHGRIEGRSPSPLFDPARYLEQNADVRAAVDDGLITAYDHFLNFGILEDRDFVPYFDADFYLAANPDIKDVVDAGHMTAAEHFLMFGQAEGRPVSPFFDVDAYVRANSDLAAIAEGEGFNALEHLLTYGVVEGRPLGNGVSLAQFANDPSFKAATGEGGNPFEALARVAEVAPFLPTFNPPAGWQAPETTPIPQGFVPADGEKLVVPPSVKVPEDVKLPDAFEPEEPGVPDEPGDGGTGGVTSKLVATLKDGVISLESVNLVGDVTVTLSSPEEGIYTIEFARGHRKDEVTLTEEQLQGAQLDYSGISVDAFKPGENTVLTTTMYGTDPAKGKVSNSVQEGIDSSAKGGRVLVGSGEYNEQVKIDKPGIKLLGPNAEVDSDDARVAEAVLQPSREVGDKVSEVYVVTVTSKATGAKVAGFEIAGDREGDIHTKQSGIIVESSDTVVTNNLIHDFNSFGVRVSHFTSEPIDGKTKWTIHLIEGVEIQNNRIESILREDNGDGIGHAIYLQGALGDVSGNYIRDSENGIQIQPYGKAYNTSLYSELADEPTPRVFDNDIEAAYRGIWLNYGQDGSPIWNVTGNSIAATEGYVQGDWQGIWVQTFEGGGGFRIAGNTIDGSKADTIAYGIRLSGIKGDSSLIVAQDNAVDGVDVPEYSEEAGKVILLAADGAESQFDNIQEAVDAAEAGDLIHVGPGTFTEDVDVNKSDLSIVLSAQTTVKGGFVVRGNVEDFNLTGSGVIENGLQGTLVAGSADKGVYLQSGADVSVKGITFTRKTEAPDSRGIVAEPGDSTIEVVDASFDGAWSSGIYVNAGNDLSVTGTQFTGSSVGIGTDGPTSLVVTDSHFDNVLEGIGLTLGKVLNNVDIRGNDYGETPVAIANGGKGTGLETLEGEYVLVVANEQSIQDAVDAFYIFSSATVDVEETGQIVLGTGRFHGDIKLNGDLKILGQGPEASFIEGSIRINDPSDAYKLVSNILLDGFAVAPGDAKIGIIALSNATDDAYNTENLTITDIHITVNGQHGLGLFDVKEASLESLKIQNQGAVEEFYAIEAIGLKNAMFTDIQAGEFDTGNYGPINVWSHTGYEDNESIQLVGIDGVADQVLFSPLAG